MNAVLCPKLEVVDVSELLARAVRIMQTGGSLAALFDASDRLGGSLDMAKAKCGSPGGGHAPSLRRPVIVPLPERWLRNDAVGGRAG